jgi:N-acyl-phosphatidylethanolamine-hydrolysing phospholipase D
MTTLSTPEHHVPGGGFRNPWPHTRPPLFPGLLRWAVTRALKPRLERTQRGSLPSAVPDFATPRADPGLTSVTWIGHATFLIQIGGLNALTDPMWSERASPVRVVGPRRYMPPGVAFDALPPIDLVLVTHDHYDHLDERTVARLVATHHQAQWITPLGLGPWLRDRGVERIRELDWWSAHDLDGLEVTCLPAQHFSGRGWRRNQALWCGWALASDTHRLCYAGDTGLHPAFREIGERVGLFDVAIMPIGAYAPRWFMAPVHMSPEDAVSALGELVSTSSRPCGMGGMHWGTFKLTVEPMTEPPQRAAEAWRAAGLADHDLWILAHGETRWLPTPTTGTAT